MKITKRMMVYWWKYSKILFFTISSSKISMGYTINTRLSMY